MEVIFETLAGSRLYGYHTASSDYDYRGVYLAPASQIMGIDPIKDTEDSTVTDNLTGNTYDIVRYELRKFCRLALNGNPNILEILFAPKSTWTRAYGIWDSFYAHRHAFLSKQLYAPYSGFLISELRKLQNKYDEKGAANAWRLAIQCNELLTNCTFSPQLSPTNAEHMRSIRLGARGAIEEIYHLRTEILPKTLEASPLPDHPDSRLVNELCVYAYREYLRKVT